MTILKPKDKSTINKIYFHYALAVAGMLLGIWNVIAKKMLNSGTNPITFSCIRHSGSWLLYRTWHYLSEGKGLNTDLKTFSQRFKCLSHNEGTFMLLAVLTCGYQICYIVAVNNAEAAVVGFFQCIGPPLTLLLGLFMGLEEMTGIKLLSITFGTMGTLCVSVLKVKPSGESPEFFGCVLLLCEALCISLVVLNQKSVLKNHSSLTVLTFTYDYVCIGWFLIWISTEHQSIFSMNSSCFFGLFYSIFIINGIVYYLRMLANSALDGSVMMLYQGVQPIATCAVSYLFLAELPTMYDIVGGACILTGLLLASTAKDRSSADSKFRSVHASDIEIQKFIKDNIDI